MARPLGLELDPRGPAPLYQQIVDQVGQRVRQGALPAGFQLPPTRDLARELGVHRNTVVRAFEDLVATGVVTSRVGSGTFVAERRLAEVVEPEPGPSARLPWDSLLARAGRVESLRRFDRLARGILATRASGRPAAGPDAWIDLQRMQPSSELLPVRALRRCLDHVLRVQGGRAMGYAPREGLPRLRRVVAEHLAEAGVPARAEDVLITTGSQQAIDIVTRVLVDPGDTVLVESSTYTGAMNLLAAAGAQVVPVPSDGDGPDMAFLRRLPRGRIKAFYLMPSCRNPTGERVSTERRRALVAWSHASGIPLVEDDYGRDLDLDAGTALPALRALDAEVIHLGTFSKKLIPALRVGYVVCPPGLAERLVPLKHAMDLSSSLLLQHALAEFLERGYLRAHLRQVLPEYRARRAALVAALEAHVPPSRGVTWCVPPQGLSLWLELPPHLDPEAVFAAAQRRGVLISPGTLHGVAGQGAHGVRLTFCGEPPARLAEGARRLGEAIAELSPAARATKRSGRARREVTLGVV